MELLGHCCHISVLRLLRISSTGVPIINLLNELFDLAGDLVVNSTHLGVLRVRWVLHLDSHVVVECTQNIVYILVMDLALTLLLAMMIICGHIFQNLS